jgi:hypothetical protein
MSVSLLLALAILWLVAGAHLGRAGAESISEGAERGGPTLPAILAREVWPGFSSRIALQGFSALRQPVNSNINPNNALDIPRYQLGLDVRPDLRLAFRRLELSVSPRLELRWARWEDGNRQGDADTEASTFVYEWLVRYGIMERLFASYGRENLQWGPSSLLAPSNPFNPNNGQNDPRAEVPGLGYGRAVWIPSSELSVSFIANTNQGRLDQLPEFRNTYALKVDYNTQGKYISVIPAYREGGAFSAGYFAGWTVSDALLLHIEGRFGERIDDAAVLVGGSYTLALGPTVTVEFLHDGSGCTLAPIERCFPLDPANTTVPSGLIRRNYLLMQYSQARIANTLNLTLRWIQGLDDRSARIIGIIDYELGNHLQAFFIGNVDTGGKRTEFGSVLRYSLMGGVSYTF